MNPSNPLVRPCSVFLLRFVGAIGFVGGVDFVGGVARQVRLVGVIGFVGGVARQEIDQ